MTSRGTARRAPTAKEAIVFRPLPGAWSPKLISVFRIVVGLLFMAHGTQKLLALPVATPTEPAPLSPLMGLAGLLEMFGGALITVGFLTRAVALVLATEMALAYVMAHMPNGVWPILNGGELALLYCVSFLTLTGSGGGPWSVYNLFPHRRVSEPFTKERSVSTPPSVAETPGRRRPVVVK
jgi:putative oxidoreductase